MEETKEVESVSTDEPAYISIEGIFGYESASETENDDPLEEKGIKRECTGRKLKGSYYDDEDWVPRNTKSPNEAVNVIIGPSPTTTVTVEEDVDELVPLNTKQLSRLSAKGIFPMPSGGSVNASLFNPVTVQWLLENYETKTGVSLPRSTVYNHYIRHCRVHDMEPVNAASFGKLIRSIFLGLQTRRLGTRGNSKYHYYGIQIKPDSQLHDVPEDSGSNSDSDNENGRKLDESSPNDAASSASNDKEQIDQLVDEILAVCSGKDGSNVLTIDTNQFLQYKMKSPSEGPWKSLIEWQDDIRLITNFTCNPKQPFARKIQQVTAKAKKYIPKIDHRQSSTTTTAISRTDLEHFRDAYVAHCLDIIKSFVLYKLDTIIISVNRFWGKDDFSASPKVHGDFSREKLITFSEQECVQKFVRLADCELFNIIIDIFFPNVLHPIPVIIVDVMRNFAHKFVRSLDLILEGIPDELRKVKLLQAAAFSQVILSNCKLNMLAEAVRPYFEESTRFASYAKLSDINFPVALSIHTNPISNDGKYLNLTDTFRQALLNISDLDSYAKWVKDEVDKDFHQFQQERDEPKFTEYAKIYIKDRSIVFYVICSQLASTDPDSNGFFSLLQLFTESYISYLLDHRKAKLNKINCIAYTMANLDQIRPPSS